MTFVLKMLRIVLQATFMHSPTHAMGHEAMPGHMIRKMRPPDSPTTICDLKNKPLVVKTWVRRPCHVKKANASS